MKNKFRKLFRKYEDIKISFLDVFKSRKNKIKVIWNGFKTNSSNNISINKKKNKKNYFFSKINFSNFKASKIHDYFFIKKSTDISKVKVNKNTQNIKSKENRENNYL